MSLKNTQSFDRDNFVESVSSRLSLKSPVQESSILRVDPAGDVLMSPVTGFSRRQVVRRSAKQVWL